jgi:hypothetical protein
LNSVEMPSPLRISSFNLRSFASIRGSYSKTIRTLPGSLPLARWPGYSSNRFLISAGLAGKSPASRAAAQFLQTKKTLSQEKRAFRSSSNPPRLRFKGKRKEKLTR